MEFEESITAMYTTLKAVAKRMLKKLQALVGLAPITLRYYYNGLPTELMSSQWRAGHL